MGVSEKDWVFNQKKTEDSFNYLREKIEKLVIIVMMSGIVGQNSNRVLNVKEFRAFALMDKYAPLIFINKNDSQTGMIFSLVHELIHLLVDHDDIITDDQQRTEIEQKINNFVAEFLIPSEYINENWISTIDPIKQSVSFTENHYNTLPTGLSDSFMKAIINQTESGGIRYTDAYRLLGINGKIYHNFKEHNNIQDKY